MPREFKVAVVGATGAVGQELLRTFERRNFPISELIPFASPRSKGKKIEMGGRAFTVRCLEKGCFEGIDLVFLDASDEISREWVPQAAQAGAWVVDKSATFRMDPEVLLAVPEVNGAEIAERAKKGKTSSNYKDRIISSPNCSTTQLVLPLKVLQDGWGLKRVVVSTYQSVSGAGSLAMAELLEQVDAYKRKERILPQNYTHQIAFNCIPHIGSLKDGGYFSEETKLIVEARKIMNLPQLRLTATAVRVPALRCHGESVNVELENAFDLLEVRRKLEQFEGIEVLDDPANCRYPMNEVEADCPFPGGAHRDPVYVGRIRRDDSVDNGLNLWVISDNLLKGAALNAIQIAEKLIQHL